MILAEGPNESKWRRIARRYTWMGEQFAEREYAWQMEVLVHDLFVVALMAGELLVAMAVRYPRWWARRLRGAPGNFL